MLQKDELSFLNEVLPFFNNLSDAEKNTIQKTSVSKNYQKGKELYQESNECIGLVIVKSGQLRAYINSPDGKEITLYRLLPNDICIMTAACILKDLSFHINISFEEDSEIIIIPSLIFDSLNKQNIKVNEFTLSLVSSRFSEVMWLLEQLVFGSLGQRLSSFLLSYSVLSEADTLNITHEFIAKDLGTAREVITRLLKYFEKENIVVLSRGSIKILDYGKLKRLSI